MNRVSVQSLQNWAEESRVFLDVRSEVEFQQGHLPGAFNGPILVTEEREKVGTTYKKQGSDLAIELGYKLVSGENRNKKMQTWVQWLKKNPKALLMCFRGGLRSQITQKWLSEAGHSVELIEGGYKACRQKLIESLQHFCEEGPLLVISGPTGAGKTHFLKKLQSHWPTLDLEAHAHHRGSAFGKLDEPQPPQAVFENRLIWEILEKKKLQKSLALPFLVEDESRLIGSCALPENFFHLLRSSSVVWLDVSLQERTENTFRDYILDTPLGDVESPDEAGLRIFSRYRKALFDIQKRLGGVRFQDLDQKIRDCESRWLKNRELDLNKEWIAFLLEHYYDPMYTGSLEKRNPKVMFRGSFQEAFDFLVGQSNIKSEPTVSKKATPV